MGFIYKRFLIYPLSKGKHCVTELLVVLELYMESLCMIHGLNLEKFMIASINRNDMKYRYIFTFKVYHLILPVL